MAGLKLALTQIVATISLVVLLSALNLSWPGGVGGTEAIEPETDAANGARRRVLDDDEWRDTWESLTSKSETMDDKVVLKKLKGLKKGFDRFAVLPYDQAVKNKVNLIIELGQMKPESCTKSNIDEFATWLVENGKKTGPIVSYTTPLIKNFLSMCTDTILDEAEENIKNLKVDVRPLFDKLDRKLGVPEPLNTNTETYYQTLRPCMVRFMVQELDRTYTVPDQAVSSNELYEEHVIKACKEFSAATDRLTKVANNLKGRASPERSRQFFRVVQTNGMCNFIHRWYTLFKQYVGPDFIAAKKVLDEHMKNPPVLDDSSDEEGEEVEAEGESNESALESVPDKSPPRKKSLHQILGSIANFNTRPYLEKIKENFHHAPRTAQENLPSDVEQSDTPTS